MSSFPLISFLITLMLAAAACTHGEEEEELVMDSAGNFLRTTEQYFIRQVLPSNGGGLVPAPIKSFPLCPLGIGQASTESLPGIPVSFAYPYPFDFTYVYTLEALNIEFRSDTLGLCKEFSKLWEVDESSSASKEPAVLVGGKEQEENSWFIIEKKEPFVGNAYKLTNSTGTVGTVPGPWENAPQLVVTNDTAKTFFVKFDKVDGATTATTSTSRVEKFGLRMFPSY